MKSTVLITFAFVLALLIITSEAAAQKCTEGATCKVGGKLGSISCAGGRPTCVPNLDDQSPERCGNKVCTGGKSCDNNNQCVCPQGTSDCGGTCRNLSLDPANCGACGNVCPSGMSCQLPQAVILGPSPLGGKTTSVGGVACGCAPPTVQCGGVCINPTNDPSNCGGCGKVCAAPNTACKNSQCTLPDDTSSTGNAGTTGPLPLDLVWNTTDPNGLPFNPDWRGRSNPALTLQDPDNGQTFVDVAKACPISDCLSKCVKFCSPGDPNCFSQVVACGTSCVRESCTKYPVTSDSGVVTGTGADLVGAECAHDNWFDATYDGKIEFDDYSAHGFFNSIGQDDDYNFNLVPPTGGAGLAGRGKLHSEMAFKETFRDFKSTFWSHFRELVDNIPGDDYSAPRALFKDRYAIVTGLLGFDRAHVTHAELHPIYGLALRENQFPAHTAERDCWAIVARNWGNEGFCSGHDHPLDLNLNRITFFLPQPGATAVVETSRDFDTNSNQTAVSEVGLVKDGAEITFFLGRPENRTQVNGEVCLRWAIRPGTPPPQAPVLHQSAAPPGHVVIQPVREEDRFPGVELLTPAQLAELARSLPPELAPSNRAKLAPKRVPFVHAPAPATIVHHRVGPVDPQKQARDRQMQSRVCQMLRGNPKRPKVCNQL